MNTAGLGKSVFNNLCITVEIKSKLYYMYFLNLKILIKIIKKISTLASQILSVLYIHQCVDIGRSISVVIY